MRPAPPPARSARAGFFLAVAAVAGVAVYKTVAADTADPDLFWHLRVADQLHADGVGPIVDTLSYNSEQTPWTPYSWGAELFMRTVWNAGGFRFAMLVQAACAAGLIVFAALACDEAARRVTHCAKDEEPDDVLAPGDAVAPPPRYGANALIVVGVAFLSLAYLSFRPVTFALTLLAACVWLLERGRRVAWTNGRFTRAAWLVPVIVAAMVNVHLTAVFVPALATLRVVSCRATSRRRAMLLAGACWLALCCTPMLPGAVRAAWHYQTRDTLVASNVIAEMRPFYAGVAGNVAAAAVVGVMGLLIARRRTLSLADWLTIALAVAALLRWGRFAPVAALLAAPVVAAAMSARRETQRLLAPPLNPIDETTLESPAKKHSDLLKNPGMFPATAEHSEGAAPPLKIGRSVDPGHSNIPWNVGMSRDELSGRAALLARPKIRFALGLFVVAVGIGCVREFPRREVSLDAWLNRNGPDAPGYPTAAAAFVETHVSPTHGRLINEFTWGGYLAWRLPAYRVFTDGRTQLYSSSFWQAALLGTVAERRTLLAARSADAAIVPTRNSAYFDDLRAAGWTVAHEDDRARVLLPPTAGQAAAR